MENSILLARLIGPFIIVIGLGLLLNTKNYLNILNDFLRSPGLIYITGLLTFTAGLSIVIFHNIWVADWRIIITLFGWMALVKGVWLILFPGTLNKVAGVFAKNTRFVQVVWIIMLAIGVFLLVKGY